MRCGARPIDGRNRLSLYLNKADDVIGDGILNFWEKPSVEKNKLMRRFETWGKEFYIRFSMKVWNPPGPAKDKYGKWRKWPPIKPGVDILPRIHKYFTYQPFNCQVILPHVFPHASLKYLIK